MTSSLPCLLIVREILYGLGIVVTMGVALHLIDLPSQYLYYACSAIAVIFILQLLVGLFLKQMGLTSVPGKPIWESKTPLTAQPRVSIFGSVLTFSYMTGLMFLGAFISVIDVLIFVIAAASLLAVDLLGIHLQHMAISNDSTCAEGTA